MTTDFNDIRDNSLQELDGNDAEESADASPKVTERKRLRSVPLKQLRFEDLRFLIAQRDGLPYLVPMALQHLEKHPFAESGFYPGDLLHKVAIVDESFWKSHPELRGSLVRALERASERVHKVDVPAELPTIIRKCLDQHRTASRRRR